MKMNDRESLELAAKAAGIRLEWDGPPDQWVPMFYDGKTYRAWNPRKDDADTLQLAAKLLIQIYPDKDEVEVFHMEIGYLVEPTNGDVLDAIRRGVLRAAAEIGRQVEKGGAA